MPTAEEKPRVRLWRIKERDKTGKRAEMLLRMVNAAVEVAMRFGKQEDVDTYQYEDEKLDVAIERVGKHWGIYVAEAFNRGRVVLATPVLRIHEVEFNYAGAKRYINQLESMVALELLAEAGD